jgi:hypothetical protein
LLYYKIKKLFHKDSNNDKENQEISFVSFLTEKLGLFNIGIKRDGEEIKEYILTDPDDSVNLGKKLQVPREDGFAKSITELFNNRANKDKLQSCSRTNKGNVDIGS